MENFLRFLLDLNSLLSFDVKSSRAFTLDLTPCVEQDHLNFQPKHLVFWDNKIFLSLSPSAPDQPSMSFIHRNGRLLGVCASVDNCRLFVGGIPKTKKREEILAEMKKVTDGVVDVIVYPSAADKTKNRGFAFVEYESHRAAAMARRKLLPGLYGW